MIAVASQEAEEEDSLFKKMSKIVNADHKLPKHPTIKQISKRDTTQNCYELNWLILLSSSIAFTSREESSGIELTHIAVVAINYIQRRIQWNWPTLL